MIRRSDVNDIGIVSLCYYWFSDHMSEGGLSASGDLGSVIHDDIRGWTSEADDVMVEDPEQDGAEQGKVSSYYSGDYTL